jgi:hypothetical protein
VLRDTDLQPVAPSVAHAFHNGDQGYLEKGSYQGTIGTFLNLRNDPKWGDICESGESVRAHLEEWLALR